MSWGQIQKFRSQGEIFIDFLFFFADAALIPDFVFLFRVMADPESIPKKTLDGMLVKFIPEQSFTVSE